MKPGRDAVVLRADDRPVAGRWPAEWCPAREELFDRDWTVPNRLVNQLESGTSSTVLTFCARTFGVLSPGQ